MKNKKYSGLSDNDMFCYFSQFNDNIHNLKIIYGILFTVTFKWIAIKLLK